MSTAARIKTWIKEILTFTDLNSEFDNVITHLNNIDADNIDRTDDYAWTGTHSFSKLVSTGGYGTWGGLTLSPGQTSNLELSLSGTTLTISGWGGAALSATNPGYVNIPSKVNLGRWVTKTVTGNVTLDLTAIDGFEFGITTGVNWASDMPFFLHAAPSDTDVLAFFISRNPVNGALPVANSIGDAGTDPVTDSQNAFIAMSDITPADYAENPNVCIGSFRMQYTGATTRWAVQTFSAKDGIGKFQEGFMFGFPGGQNGNTAGKRMIDGAGTAPQFTKEPLYYTIDRDGCCSFDMYFEGDSGSDGVGANTASMAIPYASSSPLSVKVGSLSVYTSSASPITLWCSLIVDSGNSYGGLFTSNLVPVQNANFGNGARYFYGSGKYQAF